MEMSVTCKYPIPATDSVNGFFLVRPAVSSRAVTGSRETNVKFSSAMMRYCIVIGKQYGLKIRIQVCRQLVEAVCERQATSPPPPLKNMVLKLIQDIFSLPALMTH